MWVFVSGPTLLLFLFFFGFFGFLGGFAWGEGRGEVFVL